MSSTSFYREELTGHRRRLAGIRPRIDATTPSSYFVLINRAKKDQLLSDWAHNVDAANLALLSRMTAIANQHTMDDHRAVTEERERRHREQSDADRKREQKRIEDENARMIERLQAQKSNYGTNNWQSHAAAYEKHIKEVRLRQMLIADPINAKKKIQEEKDKARAARLAKKNRKLKPLAGAASTGVAMSYERDETANMEEKEAAELAEEEERRARVEVGAFDEVDADELLAADRARSTGSLSLSEWMLPRNANHTPLHQDSHTIDSHLVLLTIDEVNRTTARSDVPLGDDWSAFTTHPPSFLHSYLLRSYDLDSGLHSHLYLPVQAVAVLAKGIEKRLERIIELLGYTEEGELYFKQSLMPKVPKVKEDKKVARLYAGRRERAGEKKRERRVVEEEKQPAEVKVAKRAEKKPKSRKPVEEEKELEAQVAAEAETDAGYESEQPSLVQANDAADTETTQQEEQNVEKAQTEPEQQQEEEDNYDEDSSQPEQQQEEQGKEAEADQPEPAAVSEPQQQPQPERVAESEEHVPKEAEQEPNVENEPTQKQSEQREPEQNQPAEAETELPQLDVAEKADNKAVEEPSAADRDAVNSNESQQQPAADYSKPDQEEKQSEEREFPDDTESEEVQSPAVVGEVTTNPSSPVPAYHKELPPPPAASQPEQPQLAIVSSNSHDDSPIHGKEASAEEEKEATPAPATPKTATTPKPASPSVSAKGVAHQHRSVASPISGTRKTPSHQSSPRRLAVPATH